MSESKTDIKRHPLAIAWDEWLASDEGQHCRAPNAALARESPYLENRLHRAFDAGAKAALDTAVREAVAETWKAAVMIAGMVETNGYEGGVAEALQDEKLRVDAIESARAKGEAKQ